MRQRLALTVALPVLFLCLAAPHDAAAQRRATSLVTDRSASRIGLERTWHTQIAISAFSGSILNLVEYVSPTEARYVAEVKWPDGRQLFRDSDLDAFGRPLRREGAKAKADELLARLTAQEVTPELIEHESPVVSLYVATEGGNVQAIDAESGETLWVSTVGSAFFPTVACGVGDKYVATVNGTTLYVLDRITGNTLWSLRTRGIPGAGPAVSGERIFVPMVDGSIEAYSATDPTEPEFSYRATGRALIQPIVTPTSLCWPTDQGHLYVAWAHRHGLRYRVETEKPILAPPEYAAGKLYLTSLDGYLYCIQQQGGMVLWTLSTGEPISSSPVVIGDTVMLITDSGMLVAANANTGQLLPGTSGVSKFLAASAERIYCAGRQGDLVVLDRASRTPVASLPLRGIEYYFANTATDRVYLASGNGMLQCLREISAEFPLIHVDMQERTVPAEPAEAAPDTEEAEPSAPAGRPVRDPFADPFSGEAAEEPADPFGGGAADPFGGGAAEPAADPFGSGAEPASDDPFGSP